MSKQVSATVRAVLMAAVAVVSAPGLARAQAGSALEEIVVTAQKREQSALEVPITITAFSAEAIERAGIESFEDYATLTPNIGFTRQGNRAYTKVAIRGVTNIGGKANSVGIYVDEFNIAPNILVNGYSRTADTSLFDVERIEILRGPQGTYFGRNTLGGAISITTRKPQPGVSAGSVSAEVNDRGGYLGRGTADLPLGDEAALGVTAFYREVAGFLENRGPSNRIDDGDELGGRVALRWTPGEAITVDVSYAHTEETQDFRTIVPSGELASIPSTLVDVVNFWPVLWQPIPNVPAIDTSQFPEWPLPTTDVPFYPQNYDRIATDSGTRTESGTDTVILRMAWEMDGRRTLTTVTGWINNDFDLAGDGDMSPYPAFTVARDSEVDAWSHEMRLGSVGGGPVDWTLGAIYAEDEITETDLSTHLASDPYLEAWGALLFALGVESGAVGLTPQIIGALQAGLIPGLFAPATIGNFEDVDRSNRTHSLGLFADATWHATERLDLSAGLRYTEDDVRFREVTRPTVTIPVGTDRATGSFDDTSPRVAANFRYTDDLSFFASAAKGYKVGGFNSDVTTQLPSVDKRFDEETGWSYEVGLKSVLAAGRVQLNAAVFLFDWTDLQVRSQDVVSQRQFVQNAADAETKGFELEINAALTESVTVRATYGYLDAEFGRFPNAVDLDGNAFDATGNRIPYAPENTASLSGEWRVPLGDVQWYARGDWTYTDQQYFDAANSKVLEIPAFDVLDLRIGAELGSWDGSLWLKNALDEDYSTGIDRLETYYSGTQRAVGLPRTFGVSLRYRF